MDTITRKEFLSLLGLGTAAVAATYCIGGCQPVSTAPPPPTNVDFTLDLTNPAYSALNSTGGYLYANKIIIARTVNGTFAAVSEYCTHAGGTIVFDKNTDDFYCPVHGSVYSPGGTVLQGPASTPLAKYNTSLSGTSLRVYS